MKHKKAYSKPKIIAHRGGKYWQGADFSYITQAINAGADIIELDIRIKKEKYIIQHDPLSQFQGELSEALKRIKNKTIYLDIKDKKIEPNQLIKFVRKIKPKNKLIIGSFNKGILSKIKKDKDITINYHCIPFFIDYNFAKSNNVDWINPIPYFLTKKEIIRIKKEFKFVPAGTENYKKQKEYQELGAHAISVHDVLEWNNYLIK